MALWQLIHLDTWTHDYIMCEPKFMSCHKAIAVIAVVTYTPGNMIYG